MNRNFSALLSKLTEIKPGMELSDVVTAERMQAIQEILAGVVAGENIKKGLNISKKSGPGWVMLSTGNNQGGTSSTTVENCPLAIYDASTEKGDFIGVTWGTIAGLQPSKFSAGGVPAFTLPVSAGNHYIFARAAVNPRTLLWTTAEVIKSSNFALQPKTNEVVRLIGSVHAENEPGSTKLVLTIAQAVCGPLDFSPCDAARAV